MQAAGPTTEVLIVYYSRSGVLLQLAEQIMDGVLRVPGAEASLLAVGDEPVEQLRPGEDALAMALRRATVVNRLTAADALVVGTPAYFGSMAAPVKRLFEDCATAGNPPTSDRSRPWHGHQFRDTVGAAFTASATPHGGNEQALHSVLTMMMHLGMLVVTPGQQLPVLENMASPYGVTAVVGPNGDRLPYLQEQEEARRLGERVAKFARWLHSGRTAWEKERYARIHGGDKVAIGAGQHL
jgi:NAD(P)H dehydrogenase (quinone)